MTTFQDPLAPPPMGQGHEPAEGIAQWMLHLVLAVATYLVVTMSVYLLGLGVVLFARIFRSTGFRARDLLVMLVPLVNAYFAWRAFWRFTARTKYWVPRTDLNEHGIFGPSRTLFVENG